MNLAPSINISPIHLYRHVEYHTKRIEKFMNDSLIQKISLIKSQLFLTLLELIAIILPTNQLTFKEKKNIFIFLFPN